MDSKLDFYFLDKTLSGPLRRGMLFWYVFGFILQEVHCFQCLGHLKKRKILLWCYRQLVTEWA